LIIFTFDFKSFIIIIYINTINYPSFIWLHTSFFGVDQFSHQTMDEICHSTEPVALAISYGFIIFLSIFAGALSFLIFIFYKLFYPQQETNAKNNLPIADSAEPLTGNVQGHDLNVQKTMKWSSSTSSSTQFRESQIHYRSNKGQKIKFETHMPAFTGHNFIYNNIKH